MRSHIPTRELRSPLPSQLGDRAFGIQRMPDMAPTSRERQASAARHPQTRTIPVESPRPSGARLLVAFLFGPEGRADEQHWAASKAWPP